MKKKWLLYCVAMLVAACSDSGNDSDPQPNPGGDDNGGDSNVEIVMEKAAVSGFVLDSQGGRLSDVKITTGDQSTFSNEAGAFKFAEVGTVNGRSVFKFSKDGYFEVVRSALKKDGARMEVVMHPKVASDISCITNFSATTGKELAAGEMKVNIPPSGLVVESTGKEYSGNVNADMLYLNPEDENFTTMMPGSDMAAIRTDNSSATLVSYGMVNVNLTANDGTALQLKEGTKSKLTFPIPEGMNSNPPATIPLWYFNEEKGIWTESGTATLNGNVYVGEVTHFSYYNLDVPEMRSEIYGKVTNTEGEPVPHILVRVGQTAVYTDAGGNYSAEVPANTPITITVRSKDYGNYEHVVKITIPGISGQTSIQQNIELPALYTVSGRIVNTCSDITSVSVWLEYLSGGVRRSIGHLNTGFDGSFTLQAPEGYRGVATLVIQTFEGEKTTKTILLEKKDLNVGNIDICDDTPTGGRIIIWLNNGKQATLDYIPDMNEGGLMFIDDCILSTYPVGLILKSYSSDKKHYTDVPFVIDKLMCDDIMGEFTGKVNLDVEELSKSMKFVVNGTGMYNPYGGDGNPIPAEIKSAEFTAPIYFKAVSRSNIKSASDLSSFNFPTFWNGIPYPAEFAEVITKNYGYGRGGILYYKNKTKNDYENLKASASQLGFTVLYENKNDYDSSYAEIAYQKGKQAIIIYLDKNEIYTMKDSYEEEDGKGYDLSITIVDDFNGSFGDVDDEIVNRSSTTKQANIFRR